MKNFEITVKITMKGYENLSAKTKDDAIRRMDTILESYAPFKIPLSNMSSYWTIDATEMTED